MFHSVFGLSKDLLSTFVDGILLFLLRYCKACIHDGVLACYIRFFQNIRSFRKRVVSPLISLMHVVAKYLWLIKDIVFALGDLMKVLTIEAVRLCLYLLDNILLLGYFDISGTIKEIEDALEFISPILFFLAYTLLCVAIRKWLFQNNEAEPQIEIKDVHSCESVDEGIRSLETSVYQLQSQYSYVSDEAEARERALEKFTRRFLVFVIESGFRLEEDYNT